MRMFDYETTPAGKPPPGVIPNFVNPPSRKGTVNAVAIAFPAIALIFVILRVYTRTFISRAFGLDDAIICVTMALCIFFSSVVIVLTRYGLGSHMWDLSVATFVHYARWGTVNVILWGVLPYLIKLSILVLYLRIFSSNRPFRLTVYGCIALICAASLSLFLALVMQCVPLPELWNFDIPESEKQCVDIPLLGFCASVIGAVTDLLVLVLPIPLIWRLQLAPRKKVGVTAVFLIGGIATLMAFIRMGITTNYKTANADVTWNYSDWYIWSVIELNVGIITSCMPPLQSLVRKVTGSIYGSTPSNNRTPSSSGWGSGQKSPKKRSGGGGSHRDDTLLTETDAVPMGSMERVDGVQHQQWPLESDRNDPERGIVHTVDVNVSKS